MDIQKETKRLVDLLAKYGYESKALEDSVHNGIRGGEKQFVARHSMAFGEETVHFDFHLAMDWQFGAYRLKKMDATHWYPVTIGRENIAGINIPALEKALKQVDWEQYPFNEWEQGMITDQHVLGILAQLGTIRKRGNEGENIANLLYVKYLPEDYCASEQLLTLASSYIHTHEFRSIEDDDMNANLAYHVVSRKLDGLYEQLTDAGFDCFPGTDIYQSLKEQFKSGSEDFQLEYFQSTPAGYASLTIPVNYNNNRYEVGNYELSYKPYPKVEHGAYCGVNTLKLEQEMSSINWDTLSLSKLDKPDATADKAVERILLHLRVLKQDPDFTRIMELLTLKYWMGSNFMNGEIALSAKELFQHLENYKDRFPVSVKPEYALNLLQGKPVAGELLHPETKGTPEWIRLDLSKRDNSGHYPEVGIDGLSEKKMKELLLPLNYEKAGFWDTVYLLRSGNVADIKIAEKLYYLEAKPEQDTFLLTDKYQKEIPFNFSLSPDRSIPDVLTKKETINPLKEKATQIFPKKKTGIRKGKGL